MHLLFHERESHAFSCLCCSCEKESHAFSVALDWTSYKEYRVTW